MCFLLSRWQNINRPSASHFLAYFLLVFVGRLVLISSSNSDSLQMLAAIVLNKNL